MPLLLNDKNWKVVPRGEVATLTAAATTVTKAMFGLKLVTPVTIQAACGIKMEHQGRLEVAFGISRGWWIWVLLWVIGSYLKVSRNQIVLALHLFQFDVVHLTGEVCETVTHLVKRLFVLEEILAEKEGKEVRARAGLGGGSAVNA